MKKKIDRTNVADHLVEYQLSMIGKTISEAYKTEDWFTKWTMTDEQFEQWKAYSIPMLQKVFKCNKGKAVGMFDWLNFQFGLRIDNDAKTDNYEDLEDLKL